MSTQTQLLGAYQMLAKCMHNMLEAAALGEWDLVLETEAVYQTQAKSIARLDVEIALSPQQKQLKKTVITQILADEEALQALVKPHMAELQKMIQGTHMQTKLNNSYAR
jgi:hypothetical protein